MSASVSRSEFEIEFGIDLGAYIHALLRMYCNNFANPLAFYLFPLLGHNLNLSQNNQITSHQPQLHV